MTKLNEIITSMNLEFFAKGNHKISFEKIMEMRKEDAVFVLDVRSKKETECVSIPFAYNIPLNEVPTRLSEIPKDKTIAVFCSSATRATILFPFLLSEGYDAKILIDTLGAFASNFKPGYVYKNVK